MKTLYILGPAPTPAKVAAALGISPTKVTVTSGRQGATKIEAASGFFSSLRKARFLDGLNREITAKEWKALTGED